MKIEGNSIGIKATAQIILDEIHSVLEKIDERAYEEFLSSILNAKIYLLQVRGGQVWCPVPLP